MYRIITTYVLSVMMFACSKGKEELDCITYRVINNAGNSYRCLISYKDSTGYVIFSTNERVWSKKVFLPSGEFASLLVIPQIIPEWDGDNLIDLCLSGESGKTFVRGEIIHQEKVISESDSSLISIQLFPSDFFKQKKRFDFLLH